MLHQFAFNRNVGAVVVKLGRVLKYQRMVIYKINKYAPGLELHRSLPTQCTNRHLFGAVVEAWDTCVFVHGKWFVATLQESLLLQERVAFLGSDAGQRIQLLGQAPQLKAIVLLHLSVGLLIN